ncbi:MAG: glycosyltransferase family 2 protein [Melioribacteraceae bacterium]|nr:glycosyltransferase family 2 protein [Melioribacteraceae bacterium]
MNNLCIIIVNYNLTDCVKNLLISIEKYVADIDCEIFVVDNNSQDRSIEKLAEQFPKVKFKMLKTNYGFGHGNNEVLRNYESKYYLLLNPDTYLEENLPKKFYDFMEHNSDVGIAGPVVLYENGRIQGSAQNFHNLTNEFWDLFGLLGYYVAIKKRLKNTLTKSKEFYNTDYIFGSCMMIRNEVIKKTNGFDEDYFLFAEETDLCYRAKKLCGEYKTVYWKNGSIRHLGGEITNKIKSQRVKWTYESKLIFFRKHYSSLKVLIIRFVIVLNLIKKILPYMFNSNLKKEKDFKRVLVYLIKYYLVGNPVNNNKSIKQ